MPWKIGAKKRRSLSCTYFAISWLVAEFAGNLQKTEKNYFIENQGKGKD